MACSKVRTLAQRGSMLCRARVAGGGSDRKGGVKGKGGGSMLAGEEALAESVAMTAAN